MGDRWDTDRSARPGKTERGKQRMVKFSISFTLGKAGSPHGANVAHNNRQFIAPNIRPGYTMQNVIFKAQPVEKAYEELFGEAIWEYNEKQKRPTRRIADYYSHIANGHREEPFYEVVVQFGDSKSMVYGGALWNEARTMLYEYMEDFEARNPNLHVFNAVMHLDEASPHLHIDFIPFYTKERQRGLKKGVSMRAAMIEQGFAPQHGGKNQLVLWEESERKIMEMILHRNGYERDEKDAHNPHLTVEEYKTVQDTKRLETVLKQSRTISASDMQAEAVRRMKSELNALHQTVSTLEEQKYSPYKSFFYASDDKLNFVMQQLTAEQIPYHETENGFEAQECYAQRIREIERSYKVPRTTARDRLRDDIDRYALTAKSFKELLQMLNHAGYGIKIVKYISVKHWDGERYIRLKSLGEFYTERALRNRIANRMKYEHQIEAQAEEAKKNNAPNKAVLMTMLQYMEVFVPYGLPARKLRQDRPLTWVNDAELNKISALNAALNKGETLDSMRRWFTELTESEREAAQTVDQYVRITRRTPEENEKLDAARAQHNEICAKLKEASEMLDMAERIAAGTYVQDLIDQENEKKFSASIPNGYYNAGTRKR